MSNKLIQYPEPKDYPELRGFYEALEKAKKGEIKRVKKATGISKISFIRILAHMKAREKETIVSKRNSRDSYFKPTLSLCKNMVEAGLLKFEGRYWTMADLFKWSDGPMPPAYEFSLTEKGKKVLEEIRDWIWYE